ncbi:DUF488 family protein [Lentzea jiangxiensis]|uniref:DUF488 family protein n=1 Tax=Lentzea jiangxiensis TaxID=641025 RepID=UPI001C4091B8
MRTDVLVDVRLNPISRKRGFGKTALTNAVTWGLRYSYTSRLSCPAATSRHEDRYEPASP